MLTLFPGIVSKQNCWSSFPCLPALDIAIELRVFTGLEPILAIKSNL